MLRRFVPAVALTALAGVPLTASAQDGIHTERVLFASGADAGETHAFRLEIVVADGTAATGAGSSGGIAGMLIRDCGATARDFFGDGEAGVDLRYSEPRVDGTQTVGGEVYLETRQAYVACAFTPDGSRMIEFFVDGQDQTNFVTGAGAGVRENASTEVPSSPEEGGPRRWQVTASGGLRMHDAPSTSSPIVETLPEGAILSNLGCEAAEGRAWCDVQPFRGGPRGWVAAEYLAPAAGAQGSAAPMGMDESALRAGQGDFDATAPFTSCARDGAALEQVCDLSVARGGGGDATVVITFPDGFERTLFFTHGEFVGTDASQAGGGFDTDWSKDPTGTYQIRVDEERYAFPEVVIFGG